ncbi:hypothetical protein CEXT_673321 [Caerostris extrusa]|uniref:Uncharacterized protein n=1 Tax=Caerostris extrusa TaxID=172846 RepID=A0AAV4Y4X8_CAEEX|nr:hypothetical protein CEXT_673321 [Caerostris extrusa]
MEGGSNSVNRKPGISNGSPNQYVYMDFQCLDMLATEQFCPSVSIAPIVVILRRGKRYVSSHLHTRISRLFDFRDNERHFTAQLRMNCYRLRIV